MFLFSAKIEYLFYLIVYLWVYSATEKTRLQRQRQYCFQAELKKAQDEQERLEQELHALNSKVSVETRLDYRTKLEQHARGRPWAGWREALEHHLKAVDRRNWKRWGWPRGSKVSVSPSRKINNRVFLAFPSQKETPLTSLWISSNSSKKRSSWLKNPTGETNVNCHIISLMIGRNID